MPSTYKLAISIGALVVMVGCSDGHDSAEVPPPSVTAQQLCDEAAFTTAAAVADPEIQEISGIVASRSFTGCIPTPVMPRRYSPSTRRERR
jgi:hypothetical protein